MNNETSKRFTKTDIYNAIIAIFTGAEVPADAVLPTPEDIVEFCEGQLAVVETAKVNAAKRKAAQQPEVDALREKIFSILLSADEPMTAAEVVIALDDEEASMGRVSNRLTRLTNDGAIFKAQTTIKDARNKSVNRMVYSATPFEER